VDSNALADEIERLESLGLVKSKRAISEYHIIRQEIKACNKVGVK
jgi:hypothetical protein